MFLFVATLVSLFGDNSCVLAAEGNAFSDLDSAFHKCNDATGDLWTSDDNLGDAYANHVANKTFTDGELTVSYSEELNSVLRSACDEYNEFIESSDARLFWMELNSPVELVCDWPEMNITGSTATFYGVGTCLANTTDCRAFDSMDLVMSVSKTQELDCRAPGNAASNEDGAGDMNNVDEEGANDNGDSETTENLAPGEETDSGERLPFLTDEDVECMDATAKFVSSDKGLASAIKTFQSSQLLKEESGIEVMGYPEEAAKAMKSACELNKGLWAFEKSPKFTCVIEGMETIAMHVHNYGSCLAKTDECVTMDKISLLRADLAAMGFNCWEDEDEDGGDSATGSSENAGASTESSEESENGGDAEESGDTSDMDEETNSTEVGNTDQEQDEDGDGNSNQDSSQDSSDGNNNDTSDVFGDKKEPSEDDSLFKALGLSESEVVCMSASTGFIENNDNLANATAVYQKSIKLKDPTKLGYTSASASEMEQVCKEQGGVWSFIESEDVTCTIKGRDRCINVYNFGNCIANNNDCQSMDPFVLVKGFFLEVLDFSCRAKCDEQNSPSSAPHKSSPHGNTNNDNLSSQQSSSSDSGIGSKLPSFTTAAIVLGIVAAVGLLGFFRYKASHGRERVAPRSSYEMTDISDLGFQVFT